MYVSLADLVEDHQVSEDLPPHASGKESNFWGFLNPYPSPARPPLAPLPRPINSQGILLSEADPKPTFRPWSNQGIFSKGEFDSVIHGAILGALCGAGVDGSVLNPISSLLPV